MHCDDRRAGVAKPIDEVWNAGDCVEIYKAGIDLSLLVLDLVRDQSWRRW